MESLVAPPDVFAEVSPAERPQTAQRIAAEMYGQTPDWLRFFREVLGVEGLVRKLFPTAEAMAAFEKTPEYAEIQSMLARLRERGDNGDDKEPTRVITVRLPKSLHESLKVEAHDRKKSINQLCIAKLIHVIDSEFVGTAK
ncbi:MAG: toxin-antitoxin system HicB family antitoxin [Pirellulaceae bacterium]|nr:toxin-antitoxin system HicB family antitoxin [Pirellulaceae bacterium]